MRRQHAHTETTICRVRCETTWKNWLVLSVIGPPAVGSAEKPSPHLFLLLHLLHLLLLPPGGLRHLHPLDTHTLCTLLIYRHPNFGASVLRSCANFTQNRNARPSASINRRLRFLLHSTKIVIVAPFIYFRSRRFQYSVTLKGLQRKPRVGASVEERTSRL